VRSFETEFTELTLKSRTEIVHAFIGELARRKIATGADKSLLLLLPEPVNMIAKC
jgi:hypothetical protein